jgi:iron complex outermembrane receptor protein
MTKLIFASSASMLALCTPGIAIAQDATDQKAAGVAQDRSATDGVQDIVVTAQRVSSSVQRTPISIQTYSSAELKDRGVTDVTSLARIDASVNINYATTQPIIAIRGVSSQNSTEVGDPAVSVAADGIFNNRPFGLFGAMYDIDRVEILRGPQGTLFGRNSTGGTINIITARPSDRDEAQIIGEVGNYSLFGAEGFANVALGDGLSARFSFAARTRDGFRSNEPVDQRSDDEDVKSGRLQLAYSKDAFDAWLLVQYTKQGGAGQGYQLVPFSYINGVSGEPVHSIPDNLGDGKSYPLYTPFIRDVKHWEVRGGLSYTLDSGISFNYLGGYDYINYFRTQVINPYFVGFGNGTAPVPNIYYNRQKPQTINQELRIASSPTARLTWQVGAYYFHESSTVLAQTYWNPGSTIENQGLEFNYPSITSESKALYGQLGFAITDQLKISGGARYTWDKKDREGSFLLFPGQTGAPVIITIPQTAGTSSSKATWALGVDYQVTPRNLLYAKVSTGYKAGGFNNAASSYRPETVTAYEIGSKNSFLDNHLQLNLAAFRMDYNDQQVAQFVDSAAGSITVNAGKSRIWGAELNLVAQSRELGRLNLSGNYTHARYRDFVASAGWNSSVNVDLSGKRLPLSPAWSFAGSYEHPIYASGDMTITPRASVKYQSKKYFSVFNFDSTAQGAYALVDLGLDFAPANDKWKLQLYVNNVADKTVFADASEVYTYQFYSFSYLPPRTYGARLTVNFN